MQNQDHYFVNNQLARDSLQAMSAFLAVVAIVRFPMDGVRGSTAEMCYSGAVFFFSRTFMHSNQNKLRDFMLAGLLGVSGLAIDAEDFIPLRAFRV